jgi:putative serine protease PepD
VTELAIPPHPPALCQSCGATLNGGPAFCGRCGAGVSGSTEEAVKTSGAEPPDAVTLVGGPLPAEPLGEAGPPRWVPAVAIGLAAVGVAVGVVGLLIATSEQTTRRHDVATDRVQIRLLHAQLAAVQAQSTALAGKMSSTAAKLNSSESGVAPLASRVLRSVFTVETTFGLGTAWAAWNDGTDTFLITANHVAQDAISAGTHQVKLRQKGRTWNATIIRTDDTNDLAVIRARGVIAPSLWQTPDNSISPAAGDKVLLVGSPYGLEGTVTTGIVSRISYDEIQTDAAANPGNSGGPAVNADRKVVGVLLSGGGENLNFLVPIQRACVTVRTC